MNKRAMLLAEETLKIVLALIAIGFLVYFLVSLWMANQDAKDLELAKASLQHLVDEINAGRTEVEIYNPEGYWLMSWPYGEKRPFSCSNLGWENCVCICDGPGKIDVIIDFFTSSTRVDSFKDKCDKQGVCKQISKRAVVGESINKQYAVKVVDVPLNLEIKYGDNEIIITKK